MTQNLTSDKTAAIAFYRQHGYALFPLNGKLPPRGLHWRKTTPQSFVDFPQNIGVALGPDDLVLDVDPRNGGDKSLAALLLEYTLPPTFKVTTGSGGTHYYFKKPPEFKIKKKVQGYPGLDWLGEGCYVVAAGSVHPDTEFDYVMDGNREIAQIPADVLKLIEKTAVLAEQGVEVYHDDQQSRSRFRAYLEGAEGAVQGQSGDAQTYSVAAVGHDYGLSPQTVMELMLEVWNHKCVPEWSADELQLKVNNAFKYAENKLGNKRPEATFDIVESSDKDVQKLFHRNGHGKIIVNQYNTAVFFSPRMPLADLLVYNEFANNIEFAKRAPWHFDHEVPGIWDDGEALRARFYLSQMYKFEPGTQLMHDAAYVAACYKKFHPVKDYLKGLTWDKHLRVHRWLSDILGAEDSTYTRQVGLKWLVAAVKRIFEPGCKFDYILVLEGKQGTFKSTAFEILAKHRDWYCDPTLDVTNKDSVSLMFGKWIIELPEMSTHFKAETTAMKSFLSRNTDRVRLPWHRVTKDYPRQSVFGGTINPEPDRDIGWLKDTTGNRRYWPVGVGVSKMPNLDALRITVDQLWAEAYQLYQNGAKIFLDDAQAIDMAENEQLKRMSRDPWIEPIAKWLASTAIKDFKFISGEDIFRDCINGNLHQFGLRESSRISRIMVRLGWEKGVYWIPQIRDHKRCYKRPEIE